jgi:signal peptidase complex subunit 2
MAKKKGGNKEVPVAAAVPVADTKDEPAEDEDYEEDELELLQVDLGDMVKLKQILDEAVAAALLDKYLEEDYRLDNFKLAIMIAACLFAVVAQFAPLPFPDSRLILGTCCCCYFILSGVLQLITTFIDQDAILLTKPLPANKTSNKDLQKSGVKVRSQFPRFSEFYTVILEYQGVENPPSVEQKWSVGQFFDKEGMFDEIGLQQEVEALFSRLDSGKYDNKGASSKKKD